MTNDNKMGFDYYEHLLKCKYDPNNPPNDEEILFTINGSNIGSIENYCVFSGLPKVGKSTFLSALIGSYLLPHFQDQWGMKLKPANNRDLLCYIDTESSKYDFYRQINRIKQFGMKNEIPANIDAFNTRGHNPKTIRRSIESYLIHNRKCSIIIVDGFLDLCLNYNDEIETRLLANWFKRITKDFQILLIGVLHLGKGGSDTLGHLGSNTDRWAQSTLLIEKNKSTKQYVLKPKFLRSAADFDPIALMNFQGKWEKVEYEHETNENKKGRKST